MNIKTFQTLNDLKSFFGFNLNGEILEKDIHLCLDQTDANDRKYHDAEILTTLAKNLQGNCLEIGTSYGRGAYKLATNTSGKVYTLNALSEQLEGNLTTHALKKEEIGLFLKQKRIKNYIQIYENSKEWIIPDDIKNIFLVFIDGCHDRSYVYLDSKKYFDILEIKGFILWHDFNPDIRKNPKFFWINESMNGIEDFCKEYGIKEVFHLKDSWIGFYKK